MTQIASPHLKTLVFDALLASFWRKQALQRFVRACGVSKAFASTMGADETKRAFLERMFLEVERHPKATQFFIELAQALAEQTAFPDLQGWEDTEQKVRAATKAVKDLHDHLRAGGLDTDTRTRLARAAERERMILDSQAQETRRLGALKGRLNDLASKLGTQQAGYDFQDWFYELMAFHEVVARRPYVTDGRQIDGTITIDGTTYLVELKFTAEQAGAPDVDSLAQKVSKKADNTMGVMVSMSGYSSTAIDEASYAGTKLLLLDYAHVMVALGGRDFSDVLGRIRRHASQTGRAYLSASDLER
ncbi:restriction endonuclease [Polyangium jinanense]|uniref:restriction endonuclease n=1 Tax=Polyangium jinanense TaxID=2829994 RepID=UPI0023413872|nr:restriction endonuclease [Polyangium jinanense]MDC3958564.1 restriction endonuclease [Polyangium jinanense]